MIWEFVNSNGGHQLLVINGILTLWLQLLGKKTIVFTSWFNGSLFHFHGIIASNISIVLSVMVLYSVVLTLPEAILFVLTFIK